MIGRLKGILVERQAPHLLIEVQGVGYELQAPMSTFFALPLCGEPVSLFTHLSVREDAHNLFGFSDKSQRQLFRELIKVSGVGPKLALAILSGMNVEEFVACVKQGESSKLVKLPGVGKKTAERLVIEMQDRLKDWLFSEPESDFALVAAPEQDAKTLTAKRVSQVNTTIQDAVSALVNLGYKPQAASKAISAVDEAGLSSEELIKRALKGMM
ncbi:MAG: Holliday junction branch migration protein RuvA [Pseudomonadota bacterium]